MARAGPKSCTPPANQHASVVQKRRRMSVRETVNAAGAVNAPADGLKSSTLAVSPPAMSTWPFWQQRPRSCPDVAQPCLPVAVNVPAVGSKSSAIQFIAAGHQDLA